MHSNVRAWTIAWYLPEGILAWFPLQILIALKSNEIFTPGPAMIVLTLIMVALWQYKFLFRFVVPQYCIWVLAAGYAVVLTTKMMVRLVFVLL